MSEEDNGDDRFEGPIGLVYDDNEEIIRQKIRHQLLCFPVLSRSMLQVGIGASLTPDLWAPVMQKMLENKEMSSEAFTTVTPSGRSGTPTRFWLTRHPPAVAAVQLLRENAR